MTKSRYFIPIAILILLAAGFLAGSWHGQRNASAPSAPAARKILYYVDPMNPSHTSDKPGKAPCGMDMEPVYADGGGSEDPNLPPGAVKIGLEKQQYIGVRFDLAEKTPGVRTIRTLGRVVPDETRTYSIKAGIQSYIREVSDIATGDPVKKDQVLATFSSFDAVGAIQNFIFALNAMDRLKQEGNERSAQTAAASGNFQQRLDTLRDLGMSNLQMEEIRHSREVPEKIKVLSPADGYVLSRNISLNLKSDRGEEWYRIANLSRVWILADVFENEAVHVKPGMTVKVIVPGRQARLTAKVGGALPQFDPASRTLKVRLEAENPEFQLKPDMFVNVEIGIELPPAITVPLDAVLDTGTRTTVFVERGGGWFEPREIKTGWRHGGRIEVTEGLTEGEKIVVSGNFLIDSESRMKLAAKGFFGEIALDPVCGMHVDAEKAAAVGLKKEHEGKDFYFCSEECLTDFSQEPGKFVEKGVMKAIPDEHQHPHPAPAASPAKPEPEVDRHSHPAPPMVPKHEPDPEVRPEVKASTWVKDLVCGMMVSEPRAKSKGLFSEYGGKTYSFCSKACKQSFDKNPESYIAGERRP